MEIKALQIKKHILNKKILDESSSKVSLEDGVTPKHVDNLI